jgi:hypothetical protein
VLPCQSEDTGLRNSPLKGFAQNQIWCEIVALACELLAWTQLLALTGTVRAADPGRVLHRQGAGVHQLAVILREPGREGGPELLERTHIQRVRRLAFAFRIRSSHLPRRRWRSSRSASCPVAKAVKRCPSMSVNRSCAPGCGRSFRTMSGTPVG